MDIETLTAKVAAQAEIILSLESSLLIRQQTADAAKLEIGQLKERLRMIGSGELVALLEQTQGALRLLQLQMGGVHMEAARVEVDAHPEADIRSAALEVLKWRQGELPVCGWLRDNDSSRAALQALADAVATPPLPAPSEATAKPVNLSMLKWTLQEVLGSLPERRDWLNPDAERQMREMLAEIESAAPSEAPKQTDLSKRLRIMADAFDKAGYIYRDILAAADEIDRARQAEDLAIELMNQAQSDAEKAERKAAPGEAAQVGSIGDDPRFNELLSAWDRAFAGSAGASALYAELIAYIDQRPHQAAPGVLTAGLEKAKDICQDVIAEADRNSENGEEMGARRVLTAIESAITAPPKGEGA